MRKLFCVLAILSCFGIQASTNEEDFFVDGKYWVIERNYPNIGKREYYKMIVDGDTLVNGIKAKKIWKEEPETGETECELIGYDKDNVVYIFFDKVYEDGSGRFVEVLDFNAKAGDELRIRNSDFLFSDEDQAFEFSLTVQGERNLNINGYSLRIIFLLDSLNSEVAWIEKIGFSKNIYSLITFPIASCGTENYYYDSIYGCYEDDRCLYIASDLNEYLGLDPDSGVADGIAADGGQDCEEPLYDLTGRKVDAPQQGRIYVSPSGKRICR